MSTSDGTYESPSSSVWDSFGVKGRGRGRRLPESIYEISNNRASHGAGVINAMSNSEIIIKGLKIANNQGLYGGLAKLNEASLTMTLSMLRDNRATSTGGAIYASNSHFNIDTSMFDTNSAYKSSLVYQVGNSYNGLTSKIGDVYAIQNSATFNTINIIDAELSIDSAYFSDNLSVGGSNGINAVGSTITINNIKAIQTFILPEADVTIDSGFIMLSYTSSLTLTDS